MNEVICFVKDYKDPSKLTNIIQSHLFNNRHNTLTIINGNEYGAVNTIDKNIINIVEDAVFKKYNVDTTLSPYTLKVIYFYLYCKHISKAEKVFLCDATDVFLNSDPFICCDEHKPTLFVEDEKIGKCPVNSEWIKHCYNQDILGILQNKDILNGGLIIGNRLKVVELLKEMCLEISQMIGRIGNYRNLDQAVLNKVVYFDRWNYNISHDNSMVNCAHLTKLKPRVEFKEGKILINGKVPLVVHQYPCFKELEIKW